MFEGIIYELDGLMIDSELVHVRSWNEYLQRFELSLGENEILDLLGRRVYDVGEYLRRRYNLPTDPVTLYEDYQQIFMKNIEDNIVPRPGLIESLQMFKDYEFKLAITSTGSRDYVYLVTEALEIEEAFDVIVAGDMVSQGYPNPTYMSACAETFALHPSYCLAFTCRRDGIEAATTAGMKAICIPGYNTPRWKAVGADLVLPYLSDINLNSVRSLWTESSDELRPQPQLFPHLGR